MTLIEDRLRGAVAAVEAADIPGDLRNVAFAAAFWSDTALQPSAQPADADGAPGRRPKDPELLAPGTEKEKESRIADAIGVDAASIALVIDLTGKEPSILVPARLLPDGLRQGAEEVTYLIAAARQGLGEEWTPVETIRTAVLDRGYVDKSRNLNKLWGELDGRGLFVKGQGRDRRLKLNGGGYKRAGDIVQRYAEVVSG